MTFFAVPGRCHHSRSTKMPMYFSHQHRIPTLGCLLFFFLSFRVSMFRGGREAKQTTHTRLRNACLCRNKAETRAENIKWKISKILFNRRCEKDWSEKKLERKFNRFFLQTETVLTKFSIRTNTGQVEHSQRRMVFAETQKVTKRSRRSLFSLLNRSVVQSALDLLRINRCSHFRTILVF